MLFHFGIQGLIVGSEANSDTAGLSQAVHFFILQCLFTFAIFFVWPHNVSNLRWAMCCSARIAPTVQFVPARIALTAKMSHLPCYTGTGWQCSAICQFVFIHLRRGFDHVCASTGACYYGGHYH